MLNLLNGVILIVVSVMLIYSVNTTEKHSTIIEKGYGVYCSTDGKFAFSGDCDNDN